MKNSNVKSNLILEKLRSLFQRATEFGISSDGQRIVNEYLEYHEFGLAFDQILYELHEFKIPINSLFYLQIEELATMMDLSKDNYLHMKELIAK
jgi:hypothetical protein